MEGVRLNTKKNIMQKTTNEVAKRNKLQVPH
jgi:hypothetical protein